MDKTLDARHRRIQIVNAIVFFFILCVDAAGIQVINALNPEIMNGLGIEKVDLSYITIIQTIAAFALSLVAAKVIGVLTAKWTLFVGMVGMVLLQGAYGLGLPYPAMLGFAIAGGLCLAWGTYSTIQGMCNSFYGESSARVYGILAGGQLLFATVMTFVAGQLLKVMSYTGVLMAFAVATAVVAVLLIVFVPQPDEEFKKMAAMQEAKKREAAAAKASDGPSGFSLSESLKKPSFWLFAVAMFTGSIITSGMNSWSSVLFTMFGMDSTDAVTMTSLYLGFSALHFVYYGFLQNKIGSRAFVCWMYGGVLLGMVLLAVWTNMPSMIWLAALSLFFVAFIKPVNSLPGIIVPSLLGRKDLPAILMALFAVYYFGVAFSNFTTARILQFIGGTAAMVYLGAMAVVTLICLLLAIKLSPYQKLVDAENAIEE